MALSLGANPLDPRYLLARQLMGNGLDTSPVYSPWQGAARVAQAGVGSLMGAKLYQDQQSKAKAMATALMGGDQGPPSVSAAMAGPDAVGTSGTNPFAGIAAKLAAAGNPEAASEIALQGMIHSLTGQQKTAEAAQKFEYDKRLKTDQDILNADIQRRTAGRPVVNVQVLGEKRETAAAATEGAEIGKAGSALIASGRKSVRNLAEINTVEGLVNRYKAAGGMFGPGAESALQGAKAATVLGIDPKALGLPQDIGAGDAIVALTNKLVVGSIGSKGEEGGFPANNFSEADRNFVTKTVPQLTDSESGIRLKIEIMKRVEQRNLQASQAYLKLRSAGVPILKATQQVQDEYSQKPLFDDIRGNTPGDASPKPGDIPIMPIKRETNPALENAPRPKSPAEVEALKPGTYWVDPAGNGHIR